MPDPTARKRLKKKMLDRWENEGGRIATDKTSGEPIGPASERKGHGRKLSSKLDNSIAGAPRSATKRRKSPAK